MASLYQRKDSPFFWIEYIGRDGIRKQESTNCRVGVGPDIRRARLMEAERTAEERRVDRTGAGATWGWVDDYLAARYNTSLASLERYRSAWATIKLFLTDRQLLSPSMFLRQHCFDYIKWREKPDKARGKYKACYNTALVELKLLRVLLSEAVVRGFTTGNPAVKLNLKKAHTKLKPEMTPDDIALIRLKITDHPDLAEREMLSMSFEIARYQGCRLTETKIDPCRDVDLARNTIRFRIKGGRTFVTALHPKLVPLFQKLQADRKATTWSTPPNRGRQWASSCWFRFLERHGLHERGVCFHSTRVTVVTELARNNVPITKAKAYVGHASSTVHEIYQRLKPDDLESATTAVG